jgi:hypothetical protein
LRRLILANLPDGGTPATLAALGDGWGKVVAGGISRYDAPGHRTHDQLDARTHTVPEIFVIVQGAGEIEVNGARALSPPVQRGHSPARLHLDADGTEPLKTTAAAPGDRSWPVPRTTGCPASRTRRTPAV